MANPTTFQQTTPNRSSVFRLLVLLTVLGLLAVGLWQHQAALDWLKLRSYRAPAAVAQLAAEDTMTPYARKVFYVNAPQLESKATFTQCRGNAEQSIVLGCYHGPQNGIYVLTVDDARLEGVEQVTAAHEMLHAAYDRLSKSERTKIDALLNAYYNNDLHDDRVKATVDAYRKSEPNELTNEMHSIFGTEVANLPAELEQYYTNYFSNRSVVVNYAARYQAEFISRQDAIKAYDAQLATLKVQISGLESDLRQQRGRLDSESARLRQLRTSDTQAYNAAVPGYNRQVNAYNNSVETIGGLIVQYNTLVSTRNALAEETKQLINEIDSTVAPISSK